MIAMKTSPFGMSIGLLVLATVVLHAQTAAPSPQVSREMKMIAFLTPAQQQQYAQARAKALADNPALLQQGQTVMTSGTAADKQDFIEKMNSHRQKLRAAMLKEDPTLEPIFGEIDQHISEMKAQQQAAAK